MDARRIAELLEPFLAAKDPIPSIQDLIPRISTYIDLLLRWNARINVTAVRDPEEIVTRHFGESLFAARHLFPNRFHVGTAALGCPAERSSPAMCREVAEQETVNREQSEPQSGDRLQPTAQAVGEQGKMGKLRRSERNGGPASPTTDGQRPTTGHQPPRLADVGSGPGFPGLPIKLWAPDISLTLIESNHKKATFLREVTRALTLTDVDIRTARAESLPRAAFDTVTLRAVEQFAQILPTVAALVRPQGRLALLIGSSQVLQAKSTLPSVIWDNPRSIPLSRSRVLLTAIM
jgi:16S rRNA G527 N7-methylase RsmG